MTVEFQLQADIDYDAYCAYVVDRAALATLLASYIVATVLIFTLQQVQPLGGWMCVPSWGHSLLIIPRINGSCTLGTVCGS